MLLHNQRSPNCIDPPLAFTTEKMVSTQDHEDITPLRFCLRPVGFHKGIERTFHFFEVFPMKVDRGDKICKLQRETVLPGFHAPKNPFNEADRESRNAG